MTKKRSSSKVHAKPIFSINALAVIIITIALIGVVVSYNYYLSKKNVEYQKAIESVDQNNLINFTKNGALVKNTAGLKKDTWYLKYNEPGLSPVNIELGFNKTSICQGQEKDKACDPSKLKSGQNVRITGNKNNNLVTVSTLVDVTVSSKTK